MENKKIEFYMFNYKSIKIHLVFFLLLILVSACAEEIDVSQTPSPVVSLQTTETPTPATSIAKEVTPSPTTSLSESINSTITPEIINWENLLTLKQIALTQDEICSVDTVCLDHRDRSSAIDVTDELGDGCLWDCVKLNYKTREWLISIIMIRAGDENKALSTSENFKSEFSKNSISEFTSNEIKVMPDFFWGVNSKLAYDFMLDSTVGTAIGPVVVLISLQEKHCTTDSDGDFICEGDIWWSSYIAVQFANLQIEKLRNAGYPQ